MQLDFNDPTQNEDWFASNPPPAQSAQPDPLAGRYPLVGPENVPNQNAAAINAVYQSDIKRAPTQAEFLSDMDNAYRYGTQGSLLSDIAARGHNTPGGVAQDDGSGLSGGPALPNLSQFASPQSLQPWTGTFTAPTAQDAMNSPGFQFDLKNGLAAIQHSAAAKGTLLTGGTMKALNDYAQNRASQEYQNVYNRAYNEYDTARQNFLTNEANRYNSQRNNLLDQWGINSDYFNMGRVNRLDDFNIFNTNRAFDYGTFNDNRNFVRGLNQDSILNNLNLAALGKPPAPSL